MIFQRTNYRFSFYTSLKRLGNGARSGTLSIIASCCMGESAAAFFFVEHIGWECFAYLVFLLMEDMVATGCSYRLLRGIYLVMFMEL